ncbi:hypothetical protein [uncultured Salegentibacter sp.]|uniref:hypothetical protein n=1 Tax=uncultured Salegentibacter sp. TaxID=259320 RepID=UPI0030DAB35F
MKDIRMMVKVFQYGLIVLLMSFLVSCNKEQIEKFDEPFVHIMQNNQDRIVVNTNRRDVVSYYIYYSTHKNNEDLEVTYSINPGDGLQEGRDYQLLTNENPLLFPSGIYRRPIQIRWLNRRVENNLDNTLSIIIESTNKDDVNIGLPGPFNYQSEFIIEKTN